MIEWEGMSEIISKFNQKYLKKNLPDLRPGDKVKVFQRIKEGDKERLQAFEGIVLAVKHGRGISATFTVRKISGGIGVERTFPMHSPMIEKIEVLGHSRVRRAKLYYLRSRKGKRARMKFGLEKPGETAEEVIKEASEETFIEKEAAEEKAGAEESKEK